MYVSYVGTKIVTSASNQLRAMVSYRYVTSFSKY